MLQLNLLPDVKIEFIKAQRAKRMVFGSAIIAMSVAAGVTLLFVMIVYGVQRQSIKNLDGDIKKYSTELKQTPDLDKILTIQGQLGALTGLHDKKVIASRAFLVAQQTTPPGVTISDLTTDFTASTMSISGSAASLDRINIFVDTLKYATFTDSNSRQTKPFTDVVLSAFGRSESATTYTITLTFDPAIYATLNTYNLIVPQQNTTNSVTGLPQEIFKQTTAPAGTNQ